MNTVLINNKNKNGNIKYCFENVLRELKIKSHSNCGKECKYLKLVFYDGYLSIPLFYHRVSNKLCNKCNINIFATRMFDL